MTIYKCWLSCGHLVGMSIEPRLLDLITCKPCEDMAVVVSVGAPPDSELRHRCTDCAQSYLVSMSSLRFGYDTIRKMAQHTVEHRGHRVVVIYDGRWVMNFFDGHRVHVPQTSLFPVKKALSS